MKATIAIKKHVRDYDGILSLGKVIYEGLSGNLYFISPLPALPVLQVAITELRSALAEWRIGGRGSNAALSHLRVKARELWILLHTEAKYVESAATLQAMNDKLLLKKIMVSSGFELRRPNTPQNTLEKVENFHHVVTRKLSSNHVLLQWIKPLNLNSRKNVKSYTVYRSLTTNFEDAVIIGTVTKTKFIDVNNTSELQKYSYWVRGHNAAGPGVLSEPITVKVPPL